MNSAFVHLVAERPAERTPLDCRVEAAGEHNHAPRPGCAAPARTVPSFATATRIHPAGSAGRRQPTQVRVRVALRSVFLSGGGRRHLRRVGRIRRRRGSSSISSIPRTHVDLFGLEVGIGGDFVRGDIGVARRPRASRLPRATRDRAARPHPCHPGRAIRNRPPRPRWLRHPRRVATSAARRRLRPTHPRRSRRPPLPPRVASRS